ncbi:MAG: hypothetical protein J1E01_11750 [Acetatifactor sp.]|nr:hypothetical protein [Acetatifactor sp.]
MTSKHLFFKAMKEDLRHKIWMIALSSLGSFLTLPVVWLMNISDHYNYALVSYTSYLEPISFIFRDILIIAGGVIAIAGAVIVGLFGFRFVFHKNMVDTYHSIPIKRSTLYGICWLNGLLIWLVPFLICLLVTVGLVLAFLAGTPGAQWIPEMLSEICINFVVLTVVFLLVYHLVLIAVMISGNILNTLVSMLILGFGAISICGLGVAFFSLYMRTFYAASPALDFLDFTAYASPLFSACHLLYQIYQRDFGQIGSVQPLMINICIMALLGGLAWLLYKRRASELAEQGIRNKAFSTVMRFVVGLAAGMGGWLVFYLMVSSPGWGVFGALLVGILVFGVMDVIFSMEFKAFFAHKLQMALTAVFCLVICFCLYRDWIGYDTYLPDKEDIAEIAVYSGDYSNRSLAPYGLGRQYMLKNLHFQDGDAAYTFLERVTNREKGITPAAIYENAAYEAEPVMILTTRVTLKNGRTYYREYRVSESDLDVVWPILSDQDYLEKNYVIDRQTAASYDMVELHRAGISTIVSADLPEEAMLKLTEAYNRDLLEDPARTLFGRGTLLTRIDFERSRGFVYDWNEDVPWAYSLWIEVYDSMEHTVAAMEELGYGEWTKLQDPDEISEIRLYSDIWYDSVRGWSVQEMTDSVRRYYGVYVEGNSDKEGSFEIYEEAGAVIEDVVSTSATQSLPFSEGRLYLSITDREEIRELMQYVDYANHMYWNGNAVFRQGYANIEILLDGEDTDEWYYFKKGKLPEKYIQRFEQLFLSLIQN